MESPGILNHNISPKLPDTQKNMCNLMNKESLLVYDSFSATDFFFACDFMENAFRLQESTAKNNLN